MAISLPLHLNRQRGRLFRQTKTSRAQRLAVLSPALRAANGAGFLSALNKRGRGLFQEPWTSTTFLVATLPYAFPASIFRLLAHCNFMIATACHVRDIPVHVAVIDGTDKLKPPSVCCPPSMPWRVEVDLAARPTSSVIYAAALHMLAVPGLFRRIKLSTNKEMPTSIIITRCDRPDKARPDRLLNGK